MGRVKLDWLSSCCPDADLVVRARVRACVRACERASMRACVRASERACVCVMCVSE